jgi:hypothetical protein
MASIGFIDLKKKESKGSLMITDASLEQESSNLGLTEPTVAELSPSSSSGTAQTGGENEPVVISDSSSSSVAPEVTPTSSSSAPATSSTVSTSSPNSMLSDLSRTFSSKKNTVPEDVFNTYKVFEEILTKMEEIDIIGKKDVPQDYTTLIQVQNSTPDKSFETNASATSSGSSSAPTGGRKFKRKTKRGRKTRKHRKNKSRKNKRR